MLQDLLKKLNLRYEDLREDERATFEQWSKTLSAPAVSINDLKAFLPTQIAMLENQQNDYQNSPQKDLFLKAQLRNLKMIHAFILGPEKRREWLEAHLKALTKNQ